MFVNDVKGLNVVHSYLSLPSIFYQQVCPQHFSKIAVVVKNDALIKENNFDDKLVDAVLKNLKGFENEGPLNFFAQAYAGHQFGHFTMLGDGRAIMIGEHYSLKQDKFDIQLKGSGKTGFSRRGDGLASQKAMLREYLFSEAMHYLNIKTSRSLGVLKTNEKIVRQDLEEGGVLIRIMESHLRVGTFEFARYFGTTKDLQALCEYTIQTHFKALGDATNKGLALLKKVIDLQFDLVVDWLRVGFVHGVMNTDNTSVTGETFDYGPCAFINRYSPNAVFSSIDNGGRYAFKNQSTIVFWNIIKFAEALLPIIDKDPNKSVELAKQVLENMENLWQEKYYTMMLKKIGMVNADNVKGGKDLADELLVLMEKAQMDYTNTFVGLTHEDVFENNPIYHPVFKSWLEAWTEKVNKQRGGMAEAKKVMKTSNPVFILRNYLVEEALEEANKGNFVLFNKLLEATRTPYDYNNNYASFLLAPEDSFDMHYKTYCGT